MVTASLVALDDDGDVWVWPGGRHVDLYTDARDWAAGNAAHMTFRVHDGPYTAEALESIVDRLFPLK